ncbi:MAG TPA: hypothetical protein PLP27_07685 [Crocinitomicaceae bacterium]|nr:hypothetical protein [Crocinitomicaceae bacterium]
MRKFVLFVFPLFLLSSCIDLIDDLTINKDGSGILKITINVSKSKLKVNSLLALDSLNGQRVPKIGEISEKIDFYADKIREKDGIKNVTISKNLDDFIFKFNIDFSNIEKLELALKEVLNEENSSWVNFEFDWIKWENNTLTRNNLKIPASQLRRLKAEDVEALKNGSYVSITRFQEPIIEFSNDMSKLSTDQRALMIKTSAYGLAENTQLLKNTIKVKY